MGWSSAATKRPATPQVVETGSRNQTGDEGKLPSQVVGDTWASHTPPPRPPPDAASE